MSSVRRFARRPAAVLAAGALVASLGACTSHDRDPEREQTAIVAVDTPFGSLNAGLPEGRTAGSTLVRGLVDDRLVGLDDTGKAVADTSFGTVQKVSDSPLTVRYTIAAGARWSDGTPVSPADLLLEWAARSGRFDEAAPAGATAAASGTPTPTTSGRPAPTARATGPTPTPSATATTRSDAVRFGATSAALLEASATPTLDAHGLTLVYDHPVADWQVDLDVDLPAHVVGRLALGGGASAPATGTAGSSSASAPASSPSARPAPAPSSSGARWSAEPWAQAVAEAIVHGDHKALVAISDVWRTGFDADSLAADPSRAVTTGPYRIESVEPSGSVTLVRNTDYTGPRTPGLDTVVVRWDLDPLAAVDALRNGDVDVVAPVVTPDVTSALDAVPSVRVSTGGGAVLQLELNEASGPFSPSHYTGADAAKRAATARAAFVTAVPRTDLASAAGADTSDALLATMGPARTTIPPVSSSATARPAGAPVAVRVLVATGDPVRASLFQGLTTAAAGAGFTLTAATPADPTTALWADRSSWDAALVPVTQAELPVASVADRWRTGGATNVTGHSDRALDSLLGTLAATTDPARVTSLLGQVGTAVRGADADVPLVRQPSVTATVERADGSGLPDVGQLPAVPWGSADLSSWWSWATQAGAQG